VEVGGPAKFFKPRCSSFFVILLFFTPFTPKNPCRYGSAQNRAFRKDSDVSPEQSAADFVARFGLSYVIAQKMKLDQESSLKSQISSLLGPWLLLVFC